jgi:predicted nucleotidyltransferase
MRRPSSSSAGATYLDRRRRVDDLRQAARRAQARLPSIRRIILFGSLAAGTPTPHSDADLLVVVASSEHRQMRDRLPGMLQALSPLPCMVDLFVLTSQELEAARGDNAPLVREALAKGIDLL